MTDSPILVISYVEATRDAIIASLREQGAAAAGCSSFGEAEQLALAGPYSGVLVDLTAMVKAKDEEKVIACSLANVYPTLRVRAMGSMLIPMTMPGTATQDKSLGEFLRKSCAGFKPRRLRAARRYELWVPVTREAAGQSVRGGTADLSWGGAFIVDLYPERVQVGEELVFILDGCGAPARAAVVWAEPWGTRRMPGYGVRFLEMTTQLEATLTALLPAGSRQARDRLVA